MPCATDDPDSAIQSKEKLRHVLKMVRSIVEGVVKNGNGGIEHIDMKPVHEASRRTNACVV